MPKHVMALEIYSRIVLFQNEALFAFGGTGMPGRMCAF